MALTYYKRRGLVCHDYTRVHMFVMSNNLTMLERYLHTDKGGKQINIRNEYGYTPLMLVVMNQLFNKEDYINTLIFNGAEINMLDSEGNSLLMLAVKYNTQTESELSHFVAFLITLSADTTTTNYKNQTLIDVCYNYGYEKLMKMILKYNKIISKN